MRVFGPHLDLETIYFSKVAFSLLGLFSDYSANSDYSYSYFSAVRVKDVEAYSFFMSVNSYLRNEVPLLNTRVRKSYNHYMSQFRFFGAGVGANYFTYPIRCISNNTYSLSRILLGKSHFSRSMMSLGAKLVVFYCEGFRGAFIRYFMEAFSPLFVKIHRSISSLGLAHFGVDANLGRFGADIYSLGFNTDAPYKPLIYQGHHGSKAASDSLVVMPSMLFSEKSSTYLNLEGLLQKAHAAVTPTHMVRKDWEIFRALGEFARLLALTGCCGVSSFYAFLRRAALDRLGLLPYWVEGSAYYFSGFMSGYSYSSSFMFTLRVLNYYWDDLLSQNSRIMAKCASLLINNNLSYS